MTETTTPTTCTITMTVNTVCGKPAVTSFTGRDGRVYAECAEHDASGSAPAPAIAVGSRVRVRHYGIEKIGSVVKLGPANARVLVPLADGSSKEIPYRSADLVPAR